MPKQNSVGYKTATHWHQRRFGFTLIELLVTIVIIAILALIVAYISIGRLEEARDAVRKADLDNISKSLESAKTDSSNNTYPTCPGVFGPFTNATCVLNSSNSTSNPSIVPDYVKSIPNDPKGLSSCPWAIPGVTPAGYCYSAFGNDPLSGCTGTSGSNPCTRYTLRTCLENSRESLLTPNVFPDPISCKSKISYMLENQ